jgi:ABC-2 type transport system permease protein
MNRAFFRAMFKMGRSNLLKLSSAFVAYEWLLTWVYPLISENSAVTEIVDNIPASVKTVFGVSPKARSDTFEAFISAQFLARIWTFLMAAYGINTANALLAKLVDDGSLLFALATPVSREEIVSTQAAVLLAANSVLIAATITGTLAGASWFGIEINPARYFSLGVLGLAFFTVISHYSLLLSVWAQDEEHALAYAYGLTLVFYALDVIGGLSDRFAWVRNLSLFQFFKPQEVLEGKGSPYKVTVGLMLAASILLEIASRIFTEKDLPL